uniref:Uncharacterized protein n=1 Tax=Paramoeba aestuarina TaxID=180227 RepID=A0A7S4KIJ0_9EUKA|mmetsp:Transcript_19557/g.30641  ORF Transcript_19557/g.30641 Transcript_19557/m.30641 type:complete len:281 (+) Transcript_19557:63-905(+)
MDVDNEKFSRISEEGLEMLWKRILELRDTVVEIGGDIHAELQNRRANIAGLRAATDSNSDGAMVRIKNESSSDEFDDKALPELSELREPHAASAPMDLQRESIIADIKRLAEVVETSQRFDSSTIPLAACDMRTQLDKAISSFEVALLDVEKNLEHSRQDILDSTFRKATSIHREIRKQILEYQLAHEKRVLACGEKQKAILQKMYELQQRLESCCHGSPSIPHIEQKLQILREDESKIRSFLDGELMKHRNMLYHVNWMEKLTQPDVVPKSLSSAFVDI